MNIMYPNHVSLFLDLNQILSEQLINLAIGVPHLSILLIDFIFIISLEIMEERSQKLLIKQHKFLNLVLFKPDWIAILALE